MDLVSVDPLTRRASLLTLGLAGRLGQTGPFAAAAKKKRKKKGDVNKLCKKEAQDWTSLITAECGGDPDCLNTNLPCATPLRTCNFGEFLTCVFASG